MTMLDQYGAVVTVTELQEILNSGRNTVYKLLADGTIPAIRVGKRWKIPKEAVFHYLGQWKSQIR